MADGVTEVVVLTAAAAVNVRRFPHRGYECADAEAHQAGRQLSAWQDTASPPGSPTWEPVRSAPRRLRCPQTRSLTRKQPREGQRRAHSRYVPRAVRARNTVCAIAHRVPLIFRIPCMAIRCPLRRREGTSSLISSMHSESVETRTSHDQCDCKQAANFRGPVPANGCRQRRWRSPRAGGYA